MAATPPKETAGLSDDEPSAPLAQPTPRRAHPALHMNRQYQKGDPQQTIRAPRASVATPQKQTAFDISGSSPETQSPGQKEAGGLVGSKIDWDAAQRKEANRSSPTPSTPSNVSAHTSSKSKAKSAALRRARQRSRRSLKGGFASDDESSDSSRDEESRQERRFEEAFKKFDPNNEGHISVSDFLHFFDTLQSYLPPLSDPLLNPDARELALGFMANANDQFVISRADLKQFYKKFTGRSLVQNMTEENSPDSTREYVSNTSFHEKELFDDVSRSNDIPDTWKPIMSPGRRSRHGSLFQRPPGPKRRGTSTTSGDYSDYEDGGRGLSDVEGGQFDITGLPLASSTPNQAGKRVASGRIMSPTLMSPTNASPSVGDFPFSHSRHASMSQHGRGRNNHGSPSVWSDTEMELEETQRNLERELKNRDALEAEVSDLRSRIQRQQQDHDEELSGCNEEIERLGKEIESKRKEIDQIKAKAEKLDNELFVFTSETYRTKEEVARYQQQHEEDRENIQSLTADNAKLVQQNSDSNRKIEILTADLRKVMSDREVALAEKASVQKKADLVAEMGRQMKNLNEMIKDRDVEIERLKAECERRQLDIEAMTNSVNLPIGSNANDGGKRNRESGRGFSHLLSDELMDAASDDGDENSGGDDGRGDEEEDEEIITTVKRTRRKKRLDSLQESSTTYKETSDRGVQVCEEVKEVSESGTNPEPVVVVESANHGCQTSVAIDASISLEEYVKSTLSPSSRPSAAILQKLAEAEAALRLRTLTAEQLEELRDQLGIQAEVFETFSKFMEKNALSKLPSLDRQNVTIPSTSLPYAMLWVWKWICLQFKHAVVSTTNGGAGTSWFKGSLEEEEKFLRTHASPSAPALLTMSVLVLMIVVMFSLTVKFSLVVNRHEAIWRKANAFAQGGVKRGFLDGWGGRRWKYLQFQLQRRYGGDRRIPI